jgi:hypothetical protein
MRVVWQARLKVQVLVSLKFIELMCKEVQIFLTGRHLAVTLRTRPPAAEAWDWATRVPAADPKPTDDTAKRVGQAAAATGAAVGVGYIIYRIVRFLPSLAPPVWWTIPENALIP